MPLLRNEGGEGERKGVREGEGGEGEGGEGGMYSRYTYAKVEHLLKGNVIIPPPLPHPPRAFIYII